LDRGRRPRPAARRPGDEQPGPRLGKDHGEAAQSGGLGGMSANPRKTKVEPQPVPAAASEAWSMMLDLVLAHERRRRVTEELGMSFGLVRAIRRLARQPMSMGELAEALGIERPNATVLVD